MSATHNEAVRERGRCDCPCHVSRRADPPVWCWCRRPEGYR